MATGDLIRLGTLYLEGEKVARPLYPWASLCERPYSDVYDLGGDAQQIEIRDTDSAEAFKLYWREVSDGDKTLYIADRNILCGIPWYMLNEYYGFVTGKEIKIDGKRYLMRLLTGGTTGRDNVDGYYSYAKAYPANNEWDCYINNEGNFSGLPFPSHGDLSEGYMEDNQNSEHNTFWNWWGMWSWCQESKENGYYIARGNYASSYFEKTEGGGYEFGFRPVLEALNTAPEFSDEDRNLGDYTSPVVYNYTVTDDDNDTLEISEYLNNSLLRTMANQASGATYIIDLTDQWAAVTKDIQHSIKIVATDTGGLSSTRTLTFMKTNSPPEKPTITSHTDGRRVDTAFYVEFTTGTDAEGETQTIQLQTADNADFSAGVQTFNQIEKKNVDSWVTVTGITNSDSGSIFRAQASGLPLNTTKYIRVGATDEAGSGTTAWSKAACIAVGDALEIQTNPFQVDYHPVNITVLDSKSLDSKATLQVYACNNALDDSPAWEDMTAEYTANKMHAFVNSQKTAENWAVAVKYTVKSNDATGEISISAIGVGVN